MPKAKAPRDFMTSDQLAQYHWFHRVGMPGLTRAREQAFPEGAQVESGRVADFNSAWPRQAWAEYKEATSPATIAFNTWYLDTGWWAAFRAEYAAFPGGLQDEEERAKFRGEWLRRAWGADIPADSWFYEDFAPITH
jgi:hypothetical protein